MTTSPTKREREGRWERRLLFSKMVEGAEHRAEKNKPCRPKESHLIFCAQWFKIGINLRRKLGKRQVVT
jgi:hypothetical protein